MTHRFYRIAPFGTALCVLLLILVGCDTVGDDPPEETGPQRVFIANQGNFGDGNGSVSIYHPDLGDGQPAAITGLGSIVQSLRVVGDRVYVMANSGNRVDVFDRESLEQVAQISDVVSPRYLVADGQTGYVTNLYGSANSFTGGKVTVLDLETSEKITEIAVGDNPEGLALVSSRLYVANHAFGAGSTVSVIDTESRAVVDTIDVACDGPRFLLADGDDEVFVFCTGQTLYDADFNVIGETDGAVRVLDGETGEILEQIPIDGRIGSAGFGQDAAYAESLERIFAIKDEEQILIFDTGQNALIGSIDALEGAPVSAIYVDDEAGRLYLGRSNGFTAAGFVTVHDVDGQEIDRFDAGVLPTYIDIGPHE